MLIASLLATHSMPAAEPAIVADQAKTYYKAEAFNIGWPNFLGPCGNRLSLRTGIKVVRDIS